MNKKRTYTSFTNQPEGASAPGSRAVRIKKRKSFLLLCGFAPFAFCVLSAWADSSPQLIPYQGRLTNPQGVPYTNGQYTLAFTLYDQPVGGNVIWGPETHYKVGVINGMVNVFLGSINTLSNVDFGLARHLGITLYPDNNPNNPAPEMVPRQMIIPAFWAKNSEKLAGYDWTPLFGANNPTGALLPNKIGLQTITGDKIATNTITGAQILNGTINSNQLAVGSISASVLTPGSVGALQLASGAVGQTNLAPRPVTQYSNAVTGGVVYSRDSGQWVTTNTSAAVDVPNLSVTITTSGRPVILTLSSGFVALEGFYASPLNVGGGVVGFSRILPGVQTNAIASCPLVYQHYPGQSTDDTIFEITSGAFHTLDFPPAGTYTYKVTGQAVAGQFTVYHAMLVAYEL